MNYYNQEGYADPVPYQVIKNLDKESRKYRPLVYVCSPYAGDVEENTKKARVYCRFAVEQGAVPLAPHLLLPQFLKEETERELAMFMDLIFLGRCVEIWVFGETISNGMRAEIKKAKEKKHDNSLLYRRDGRSEMRMTIYTADCIGNAKNCEYKICREVTCAEELKEAVKMDHVGGLFDNYKRCTSGFVEADVIVMDCDNDRSDNPGYWMTMEKLEELFPDVSYAVAPSRNHMCEKDGKRARPKFHVYFPVGQITDVGAYADLKKAVQRKYPFFDRNAIDAARFIYGADTGDVVWHDGWVQIDEVLEVGPKNDFDDSENQMIQAGARNSTLSRFAGRVLKRYGDCEKAHELYMEEAKKCDPPLEADELITIWKSAVKFFQKIQSQEGYVAPDSYNQDFEAQSLKPEDYSDIGQAKVLVKEYGQELCYTDATDYLRYDGVRWRENKQMANAAMVEFLDLQLADAIDQLEHAKKVLIESGVTEELIRAGGKQLEKTITGNQIILYYNLLSAKQYYAFVMKRRDMKYIASALNVAKTMLTVEVSALDRDENLLNTPAATFDLKKGINGEKQHDAGDLITKVTGCSPGEKGIDVWKEALHVFFCGNGELISYVQQVVGMAAIGKVYQEHLIIAYGGGANGKSTFWNAIYRVLGDYAGKISAETLTIGYKRNVKPETAELKGKRLVIASEMEEGMRLNTAMVKQLCSTDEIQAEKKYKDPFQFVPSHTLVLYTNHLPKVGANDDGIWRRLVIIPFNAKISDSKDVKNYTDYLVTHAGPAILSWIIEGAKKVGENAYRLSKPDCVEIAINEYKDNNDWLGNFINECCEVGEKCVQKSGEFYQEYRAYCLRNGEYTRCTTDFYTALEQAGFERRRNRQGRFVHGVQVKSENFLE